jgi:hypothetical protein
MRPFPTMFRVVFALALVALGSAFRVAHAQAWVGDKGALDLSLDYNLGSSDKVFADVPASDFNDAGTTTHQITLGAEYVPVPRLAVGMALPFVALKYTGNPVYVHPGGGSYDDGDTHTTLTDLRVGARYQVIEEPLALAPHLAVSIPVADYETVGNTVAGRHLKALHLGVGIGKVFAGNAYVHLLYEFSLVEKYDRTPVTKKYGQDRSDVALTLGYKLLQQRLDVHIDANARVPHGGVNFSELNFGTTTDEVMYHDAILKEEIVLVGAGLGYQLTNALGVNLGGRLFVTGKNTQNASVLALGLVWSPL